MCCVGDSVGGDVTMPTINAERRNMIKFHPINAYHRLYSRDLMGSHGFRH